MGRSSACWGDRSWAAPRRRHLAARCDVHRGRSGLLAALLILLTVREPTRGIFDSDASRKMPAPPIGEVVNFAVSHVRVRDTILAMVLASIVSIGVASWIPVLLIRVYALPLAKAGLFTALIAGLPGALGSLCAGWIAARFGGRDDQLLRLCGTAVGMAAPLGFFGAWVGSLPLAIVGFTLWGFANTMFIGPGHSLYLNAAAPRMRGTLSAVVVILCNLVGAGLGPLLVGSISDVLHAAGRRTAAAALDRTARARRSRVLCAFSARQGRIDSLFYFRDDRKPFEVKIELGPNLFGGGAEIALQVVHDFAARTVLMLLEVRVQLG